MLRSSFVGRPRLALAALLFALVAVSTNADAAIDWSVYSDQCTETQTASCHGIANCNAADTENDFHCTCPDGMYGSGLGDDCSSEAGVVRVSFLIGDEWDAARLNLDAVNGDKFKTAADLATVREWVLDTFFGGARYLYWDISGFVYRIDTLRDAGDDQAGAALVSKWFTANLIFEDLDAANAYLDANAFEDVDGDSVPRVHTWIGAESCVADPWDLVCVKYEDEVDGDIGNGISGSQSAGTLALEPRAYTWTTGTTDDPIMIMPTGLEVDRVFFKHNCASAGCWIVDVTYTRGEDNANTFYIPRTNNDDLLSFDYDYDSETAFNTYPSSDGFKAETTFQPANFPCGNDNYNAANGGGAIQKTVSACCIPEFIDNYRPLGSFSDSVFGPEDLTYAQLKTNCAADLGSAPEMTLDDLFYGSYQGTFRDPAGFSGRHASATTPYAYAQFPMTYSQVEYRGVIDPYLNIYQARFYLDEIELRRWGGKLEGTVSVQHTVDFFVGLAEFKPTGLQYIDMATKQVDIHVEKTDYFTVATHGTNAYTFLRYVNLRLVQVYTEDTDLFDDAVTADFDRTDDTYKAQYVQVTFTVGAEYGVKPDFDIIPLDSVRVGRGTFFSENMMKHACLDWTEAGAGEVGLGDQDKIDMQTTLDQDCGPQSAMCDNPASIPDSFVSFNVPVGNDWFPGPQPDLSAQIFVDMVIQVENREAMMGAGGSQPGAANITKTTLTAAIPVVTGGINIFCDGITAKTDLKDVANVMIVIGSAMSENELSRLRIINNMASSTLDPQGSTQIDSDSIESGLMTLIVQGNAEFFTGAEGRASLDFGIELEDVITIHVMEETPGFTDTSSLGYDILQLVNSDGDELYDSSTDGLRTTGYALNGAFDMKINTASGMANIHPSQALRELGCAFSAQRTASTGGSMPTSCIIRRDVQTRNKYPVQNGADFPTATELPSVGAQLPPYDTPKSFFQNNDVGFSGLGAQWPAYAQLFMQSILGASDYSASLGEAYSGVIATKYKLNDRYNRAWWINPGYEWTPTQTNGATKFTISQKLFFFALIGLNENRGPKDGGRLDGGGLGGITRRMLLQADVEGGNDGASQQFESTMTVAKALSQSLGLKEDDVAVYKATMQLTQEQACMEEQELQDALRTSVEAYIGGIADKVADVQVQGVKVARNGVSCADARRSVLTRKLLETFSDAEAELMLYVVFEDDAKRFLDTDKLEDMDGLKGLTSVGSAKIPKKAEVNTGSGGKKNTGGTGKDIDDDSEESSAGLVSASFSTLVGAVILAFLMN